MLQKRGMKLCDVWRGGSETAFSEIMQLGRVALMFADVILESEICCDVIAR